MFAFVTKRHAPILLSSSALTLQTDRRFQAALHLYMGRVSAWYDDDGTITTSADWLADKKSHSEDIGHMDPDFFSRLLVPWRKSGTFGVGKADTWMSGGDAAAIEGTENHLYYFEQGWPTDWQRWLRKEDCVPCGIFHLNSGPGVAERALATLLAEDPDTRIKTPEQLRAAVYKCRPAALKAIGSHEVLLTKPLRRCGMRNGDPEEVLNMHTGQWETTGNHMKWS